MHGCYRQNAGGCGSHLCGSFSAHSLGLQMKNAGNDLQAVLDAMIDFSEQEFFLRNQ